MKTIKTAYGKRDRVFADVGDRSRTKQSFRDDCDVTNIVNSYYRSGTLAHANSKQPHYGFATSCDFREALELVAQASKNFAGLDSAMRKQFNDQPGEFLAFVENPSNLPQMAQMGLLNDEATLKHGSTEPASEDLSAAAEPSPETEANTAKSASVQ